MGKWLSHIVAEIWLEGKVAIRNWNQDRMEDENTEHKSKIEVQMGKPIKWALKRE